MLFLLVESRDSSVVTFSTGLEPPVSNSIAFSMRLFARAQLSLGDKSSSCNFSRVVDESRMDSILIVDRFVLSSSSSVALPQFRTPADRLLDCIGTVVSPVEATDAINASASSSSWSVDETDMLQLVSWSVSCIVTSSFSLGMSL